MSKILRKSAAALAALALAGTMAACGSDDDDQTLTIGYITGMKPSRQPTCGS